MAIATHHMLPPSSTWSFSGRARRPKTPPQRRESPIGEMRRPRVSPGPAQYELERERAGRSPVDQETDARPSVNRPAWLFSARASVSSHSATSSKPSSWAVLANPGYISLYS